MHFKRKFINALSLFYQLDGVLYVLVFIFRMSIVSLGIRNQRNSLRNRNQKSVIFTHQR